MKVKISIILLAGLSPLASTPAFAQDMVNALESQYAVTCASPSDAMQQQACSMIRTQIDTLKQERLQNLQDADAKAAQEAQDAQVAAQAAQLQATAEQMKASMHSRQAAPATSYSAGTHSMETSQAPASTVSKTPQCPKPQLAAGERGDAEWCSRWLKKHGY